MTTQNPSHSRIVAVWLVLLAFLCCMMVPSFAHANKEMTIATEGDPGDGMDFSGGGGGILDGADNQDQGVSKPSMELFPAFLLEENFIPVFVLDQSWEILPQLVDGKLVLFINKINEDGRAIR